MSLLDIRVGRIMKVDQHPNAESLYVEEIDLGEEKPRQVAGRAARFQSLEPYDREGVDALSLAPGCITSVQTGSVCKLAVAADRQRPRQVRAKRADAGPRCGGRLQPETSEDAGCAPVFLDSLNSVPGSSLLRMRVADGQDVVSVQSAAIQCIALACAPGDELRHGAVRI